MKEATMEKEVHNETPIQNITTIVSKIASKSSEWKATPLKVKIVLLRQIFQNLSVYQKEWETLSQKARGVDVTNWRQGCGVQDIHASGIYMFASALQELIRSLEDVERTSRPTPPIRIRTVATRGKRIVQVFPKGILQRLEFLGLRGEIVLSKADSDDDSLQNNLEDVSVGGVVGILGPGNFDAPYELLHKMFLDGKVCLYKTHPINDWTAPVYAKILEPLVTRGYLAFLSGGSDVGCALIHHAAVDEVVLTGGMKTLNKIKWGSTAKEQEENQKANTPLLDKDVCAELGGVNSWIYAPGEQWNKHTVDRHACHLVWAKLLNNGYTCGSPQVVIVPENWEWREEFLNRIRHWFGRHAGGSPFYPGSKESHSFFRSIPNAEIIRGNSQKSKDNDEGAFSNHLWPILIPNVSIENESHKVIFHREAFCPVLAEVGLTNNSGDDDPMQFLKSAIQFSEKHICGSLSMGIFINDNIVKQNLNEFDEVISSIPYGAVGVNITPLFATTTMKMPWGAYPGYEASGSGKIGNSWLFKNAEKSVVHAPFKFGRMFFEVVNPRRASLFASRLTDYRLRPGILSLIKVIFAFFLGV